MWWEQCLCDIFAPQVKAPTTPKTPQKAPPHVAPTSSNWEVID